MEVSMLQAEGLPSGCILSVRAGTTRRQAAADPNKLKLMFPKGLSAAEPFKIDLLAPLGSVALVLEPGVENYPVALPKDNPTMTMTLCIRDAKSQSAEQTVVPTATAAVVAMPSEGEVLKPDVSTASRRHKLAIAARTFLDEHRLLEWVQNLLQDLIRDCPSDPWTYIDERTMKARQSGVKDPTVPIPKGSSCPEVAAVSLHISGIDLTRMTPKQKGDLSQSAVTDLAALAGVPAEQIRDLEGRPASVTLEAGSVMVRSRIEVAPGSSVSAVTSALSSVAARQKLVASASAVPGIEEASNGPITVDASVEAVKSAEDGMPSKSAPSPPPVPTKSGVGDDSAPVQAKATAPLGNGGLKGDPDIAAEKQDVAQLRSDARDLLAQASVDGRLEGVLAGVKGDAAPPQDVSQLRSEARDLLAQASVDGRLEGVLAGVKGDAAPQQEAEDIDALRAQAKEKLLLFSQRGGFQALDDSQDAAKGDGDDEEEVAQLRDVARNLLADASESGMLESILSGVKHEEVPTPTSPAGLAGKEVAELREQAAQAAEDVVALRQTFQDTKQDITELQTQALAAKSDVTEIRDWAREAKKDMDDLRRFANEAKIQMQAAMDTSKAASS